jgi:hypothetical protein
MQPLGKRSVHRKGRAGKLATIRQLHEDSGIPESSIRDVVLRGDVPHVKLGNGRVYWVAWTAWDSYLERSQESGVR